MESDDKVLNANIDITGVRKIERRCLLMSDFSLRGQAPYRLSSRMIDVPAPRNCNCNWSSKDVCILLQQSLGTPSGSAAFLGLSLFKADKTAGSERVSGDKFLLCDGKDSSLERTLLVVGMQS